MGTIRDVGTRYKFAAGPLSWTHLMHKRCARVILISFYWELVSSRSFSMPQSRYSGTLSLRHEYISVRKKLAKYQSDLELWPWMLICGFCIAMFGIYSANLQLLDISLNLYCFIGGLFCFGASLHVKTNYPFRVAMLKERLRGLEETLKKAQVKIPAICESCGKKLGWEGPWRLEPSFRCTQCGKAYCKECQIVLLPAMPICPQCGGLQEMEGVFQPAEEVHLSERVKWVEGKTKGVLNLTDQRIFFLGDSGFPISISYVYLKAISISGRLLKKLTLTYKRHGCDGFSYEDISFRVKDCMHWRRSIEQARQSFFKRK